MVKVNNKTDLNEKIYELTLNGFQCCGVSIADFEQVNPDWVGKTTRASI